MAGLGLVPELIPINKKTGEAHPSTVFPYVAETITPASSGTRQPHSGSMSPVFLPSYTCPTRCSPSIRGNNVAFHYCGFTPALPRPV